MFSNCFDSVLAAMERLEIQAGLMFPMKDQIYKLHLQLRFLKMFSCCLTNFDQEAANDMFLGSVMMDIEIVLKEAEEGLSNVDLAVDLESKFTYWETVAANLLEKVRHLKVEIRDISVVLFRCPLESKSCTGDEILEFMDFAFRSLKDLVSLGADIVVSEKKQINALEEQLSFLRNLVDFTAKRCVEHEKLQDLFDYVKDWVNKLVLRDCSRLVEIPSSIGDIPTLRKMMVLGCQKAKSSARRILEEQQDMGNDNLEVIIGDEFYGML
ncbi:hypothetical protein ACH5RR_036546 [Cinchona calisaya]|uniref:Late blight resistance protein R1A-like N-terminal domain-containing protein n=1 Tax=Cinchona calisaya TaxID=153742 RepID=A0ABD2Y8A5_9GENT